MNKSENININNTRFINEQSSFTELIDYKVLKLILNNEEIIKSQLRPSTINSNTYDPFYTLKEIYKRQAPNSEGLIELPVKYLYSKNDDLKTLRLFAKGGISLQTICRELRNTLSHEIYNDIDIKNCHPSILYNICKNNKIPCDKLIYYITHKDEIFKDILIKHPTLSRDFIKIKCLKMFNGGSLTHEFQQDRFFQDLAQEINLITSMILTLNQYANILKVRNKYLRKDPDSYNIQGKLINCVYCYHENILLNTLVDYVYKKYGDTAFKTICLCFDGFLLNKNYDIKNVLEDMKSYVYNTTNFKIELSIKDMSAGCLDLSRCKDSYLFPVDRTFYGFKKFAGMNITIPKNIDDFVDWANKTCKYIINGGNSYIMTRERHSKQENGFNYISLDYTINKASSLDNILSLYKFAGNEDNNGCKLSKFFKDCLSNGYISVYRSANFFPYYNERDNRLNDDLNIFNSFEGFRLKEYKSKRVYDFTKSLLYDHIKEVICSNNLEIFEYFIKYISHLIQKPYELAETAIFIQSNKQGVGKNLIIDFIRRLIGNQYYVLYKSGHGFFNKFNQTQKNKLLVVLDELKDSNNDFMKNHNILKGMITSNEIHIEPKGMPVMIMNHHSRYIFLSNNKHSLYIEASDRRFVVIECDSEFIHYLGSGKEKYFKNIVLEMDNDDFLKSAFDYFSTYNIENWHPRMIVNSSLKQQLKFYNLNTTNQFLGEYINEHLCANTITEGERHTDYIRDESKFIILSEAFWTCYKEWCSNNNERSVKKKTFEAQMNDLSINKLRWYKTGIFYKKYVYSLCVNTINKALQVKFSDYTFNIINNKPAVKPDIALNYISPETLDNLLNLEPESDTE